MSNDNDRWVVVPNDHPRYPWAVRDQAGELGDLWQRYRGHAERIARDRNRKQPWSVLSGEEGERMSEWRAHRVGRSCMDWEVHAPNRVVGYRMQQADAEQIVRDHNDAARLEADLRAAREEAAGLKRALAWYADDGNYEEGSIGSDSSWRPEIDEDRGERARAALAPAETAPSSGDDA